MEVCHELKKLWGDRYDNDLLYFNAQGSDFKRQYRVSNSVHAKIEKMLEFVKSDQLLAKLNEIKAEYKKMIQEYADNVITSNSIHYTKLYEHVF